MSKQQQNKPVRLDSLKTISPLTDNQKKAFESYKRHKKNLTLHGSAGTGKTYISIYLALEEILEKSSIYNTLYIVRSIVPTRDIGFLPGSEKEKIAIYEDPYMAICNQLFSEKNSYERLKIQAAVEFLPTSFLRGLTFSNCVILVDECQNLNFHELDSIITRVGNNCKIIFCGDFYQSDFDKQKDKEGLNKFLKIINNISEFINIEFTSDDIVRSDLVKSYIIAKNNLREQGII